MTRADLIALHAGFLRRWFDIDEAQQQAAHYVDSGQAWGGNRMPAQMELFA